MLVESIKSLINKLDFKMKTPYNLQNDFKDTDKNILANQLSLELLKSIHNRSIADTKKTDNKKKKVHIHLKKSHDSKNRIKNYDTEISKFSLNNKKKKTDCTDIIWSDSCENRKNNFDITKNIQIRKRKTDWIIENHDDQVTVNKNFSKPILHKEKNYRNFNKSNQKLDYSEYNQYNSSNIVDSADIQDNTSLDEDSNSIQDSLNLKNDSKHKCNYKGRNRSYKDKLVEEKFQNHSEIIDDSNDDISDNCGSSSSGEHFKEFFRNIKNKKDHVLELQQIKNETYESLKSTIFDICEFLFKNLIKVLTWRTSDDEENYWINLIRCFFSTLINYTTSDFDRKMKNCLKNEEPKKFIRITKLRSNENIRFSDKINHIKCKLSRNNKKKFIPCFNNEKICHCKY